MMRPDSSPNTSMGMPKPRYGTAADLVASVKTLLTLPDVYLRVKAVVEDPDSYLTDLVNAISVDPGITARLLRLVNSAHFNLCVPVENIRQAVNLIGMKPVHDLVLATTLTSTLAPAGSKALDMRTFWVNSVRRAVYARLLAGCCNVEDRDRFFVVGLLSQIGHQVMYLRLPEQTSAAFQASVTTGSALASTENAILGFNYADVGGELMRAWDMPDSLTETVRGHVEPDSSARFALDMAIVHIADALACIHEQEVDRNLLLSEISPVAWQITNLTPEDLLSLRDQAVEELDEALGILLSADAAA
ncbi:MAG: HDOD domain-containing protein [Sedimenticolaceae bacterium]